MITKIYGEQPFQVLTNNFSISPSQEGYTLQISADGRQYSNLFTVGAGVTRLVTGVAANSYYRLSGNQSEVSINWMKTCVTEGGGSGTELQPVADFPLNAVEGTVISYTGSSSASGVYQYNGNEWTEVGADIDLSAYWTSAETQSAITAVEDHLYDVERVTATALTELHDNVLELSARTVDLSGYYTSGETDAAISAATSGKADAANITDGNGVPAWNSQGIITGKTSDLNATRWIYVNDDSWAVLSNNGASRQYYIPKTPGNAGDILVSPGNGSAPVWSAITAADPTTLKSVSELNPDAENGDVQSLYNETSGLPADVSFVTGNTYGSMGDRFGGTLTIQQSFEAEPGEPVYLFNFVQDGYSFDVTATGDAYGDKELVITCDNHNVLTLRNSDAPGRYNFDHNGGGSYTMSAVYSQGDNNEMIVDFYRYGGGSATDPVFNVPEASTEYGLYIKTGNGWEEISTPEDVVTSSYISNIWKGTQIEYDAIVTKDPDTFYIIVSN